MKLNTPGEKADWEEARSQDRNNWQKVAAASGGIITPSNFISVAGLVLVIIGLVEISFSNYVIGALLIALGRGFDLLDGLVAELTKTKSPLGETVDTTIDKFEIFTALVAITLAGIMPKFVIFIMLFISLWIIALSLLARLRQSVLHPNLAGKLATAAAWICLILFLLSNSLEQGQNLFMLSAYLFFAVFVWLGSVAIFKYSSQTFTVENSTNQLISQFDNFAVILNPKSSNASRTLHRIKQLKQILLIEPQIIRTNRRPDDLAKQLRKYLAKNSGKTMLMIGGGDGTVHAAVNGLIINGQAGKNVAILPIWGGNANDLANMLNGMSYRKKLAKVLSSGRIISVHPLEITIDEERKKSVRYAVCYASFGATAFAAQQLDLRIPGKKNFLKSTPLALAIQEILGVTDAFRKAPVFSAEINGEKVSIFEEAFMNGRRMAKINSVPVKLTDRAYYHAHQPDRHPLLSRRVVQTMTGRKFGTIRSKATSFTLQEPALAQFDGEVSQIAKNSKITVSVSAKTIQAISLKL